MQLALSTFASADAFPEEISVAATSIKAAAAATMIRMFKFYSLMSSAVFSSV
jgi:hypothetical protein